MTGQPFPTLEVSDPELERDGLRLATVFSPALDRRADCTVWLPPGGRPTRLVILLHGVYGSHWAWAAKGAAHHAAADLAALGAPIALAMPSDGLFGHGSGYVDHAGGRFERWVVDEVPALASLLADTDLSERFAIGGLSMGGYGALSVGARHGDRVAAVAAMSAMTDFAQMPTFVGSLDRYADVGAPAAVLDSILDHRERLPALRLDCGRDDLLIQPNRQLHAALEAAGIAHEWHERPGAHDWSYWRSGLPDALRFCVEQR